MRRGEIARPQEKDLAFALFCVEPDEWQAGKVAQYEAAAPADLTDERALGRQMFGRLAQDPPHDVEPVRPARMRSLGLRGVFGRKGGQSLGVDVGRIDEDEIIAALFERREEIAFDEGCLLYTSPSPRD